MKRLAYVAVALAAIVGTHSATAQAPIAQKVHVPLAKRCTAKAFQPFSARVWRLIRWEGGAPRKKAVKAQRRRLRCAPPRHRKKMQERWRKDKIAYNKHREAKYAARKARRERLRYLPFDCGNGVRSAIDCGIMLCESGGSYTARNPSSTAGGRYQIIDSTWYAYGGQPNGDSQNPAAAAPPSEQDRIASAIWNGGGGRHHWVC